MSLCACVSWAVNFAPFLPEQSSTRDYCSLSLFLFLPLFLFFALCNCSFQTSCLFTLGCIHPNRITWKTDHLLTSNFIDCYKEGERHMSNPDEIRCYYSGLTMRRKWLSLSSSLHSVKSLHSVHSVHSLYSEHRCLFTLASCLLPPASSLFTLQSSVCICSEKRREEKRTRAYTDPYLAHFPLSVLHMRVLLVASSSPHFTWNTRTEKQGTRWCCMQIQAKRERV